MNKQVLIETRTFSTTTRLTESKVGGNTMVEGILTTVNQENGNNRVYPKELWVREMKKYAEVIKDNRALGELDHPESSIINLQNVSHNIKDAYWDGDHVIGKIEILPTPSGNILKALIDNNVKVGVSSRGMGSVKQIGETVEVQDDFELLCWDFVSTPSNPGSWMHEVSSLNESIQPGTYKYNEVNAIITEILCSKGSCPIL